MKKKRKRKRKETQTQPSAQLAQPTSTRAQLLPLSPLAQPHTGPRSRTPFAHSSAPPHARPASAPPQTRSARSPPSTSRARPKHRDPSPRQRRAARHAARLAPPARSFPSATHHGTASAASAVIPAAFLPSPHAEILGPSLFKRRRTPAPLPSLHQRHSNPSRRCPPSGTEYPAVGKSSAHRVPRRWRDSDLPEPPFNLAAISAPVRGSGGRKHPASTPPRARPHLRRAAGPRRQRTRRRISARFQPR